MSLDDKQKKKLITMCTKISNVFNDFYVLTTGYCISMDIEKPFIVQLNHEYIDLFKGAIGEFTVLHICNVKEFKKELTDFYEVIISKTDIKKLANLLTERITLINTCDEWEKFLLSDNEEENEKLMLNLFKKNDYINFQPNNSDGPEIILTKSLLPIVSEKNYTDLYYATKKIQSDLYLIVFDFQFSLFRLYMLHYYIPIKNKDNANDDV